jgi:signal transduction protein with GAF and PtsI domain
LLASGLRLGEGLELILSKICELFGTDTAYIAMPDEEKNELYIHTTLGINTDAFKKIRVSFNKGLGLSAKAGKGYIIHDCLSHKGLEESLYSIFATEGIVSIMAVPVQFLKKDTGLLCVANRTYTLFSETDLENLITLVNHVTLEINRFYGPNAWKGECKLRRRGGPGYGGPLPIRFFPGLPDPVNLAINSVIYLRRLLNKLIKIKKY